jgi:hypothetical protein
MAHKLTNADPALGEFTAATDKWEAAERFLGAMGQKLVETNREAAGEAWSEAQERSTAADCVGVSGALAGHYVAVALEDGFQAIPGRDWDEEDELDDAYEP